LREKKNVARENRGGGTQKREKKKGKQELQGCFSDEKLLRCRKGKRKKEGKGREGKEITRDTTALACFIWKGWVCFREGAKNSLSTLDQPLVR